jgi:hypothetical protein
MEADYFENNYKQDHNLYLEKVGQCLCGRTLNKLFKNNIDKEFISLKNYLYCQFELNLIGQIIFTHFNNDYDEWKKIAPKYTDCRCTYEKSPIRIFENSKKESQGKMSFTKKALERWDVYFMDFLEKLFEKSYFKVLTKDFLTKSIKEDSDCDIDKLLTVLEK